MNNNIVVIYQFSLIAGNSEETFMGLNAELDQFLLGCEGFLYRSVAKNEDGKWLDIIYWADAASADKAMTIENLDAFKKLMAMLDMESLSMQKARLHSAVMPEMTAA